MAAAILCNLLSDKEIDALGDKIHPKTPILDLRWSHLSVLGLIFIQTELDGIAPGGHVAIIAVETLAKRAVAQDYPINE